MADTLASVANDVARLQKELSGEAMMARVGLAAKKAALEAAAGDLGADRAMSGFRRRNARLNARYDVRSDSAINLELYPKGLWMLANDGRRRLPAGGRVYPRKRGAKALNTPWGPRASVAASTSRGLGTLADAERDAEGEAYKAADRQVDVAIRTVFR